MSAVIFLLMAFGISCVGTSIVVVRNRAPRGGLDAGIDDFRREMQALAPRDHDAGGVPGKS